MQEEHIYQVHASCTAPRSGITDAEGITHAIEFSAPPEFAGIPGRWTPEHFFVAAVATCFMSTFSGMAESSKFPFVSFALESEGVLTKPEDSWRFTEVRLRPTVVVHRQEDFDRANRLLEKAAKTCLVARSISARVDLAPVIKMERELVLPKAS